MTDITNRVLITGRRGQLGSELCSRFGPRAIAVSSDDLDLNELKAIRPFVIERQPSAVIHTAAFTDVDRAEEESKRCRRVNGDAVAAIAHACRDLDIPLVYLSTDYVFGGDEDRFHPYLESDTPNPVNQYGLSKLIGENMAAIAPRHFVLRTCGLYSWRDLGPAPSRNFADRMLLLAQATTSMRIVNDQHCAPTYTPHLANIIEALLATEAYGVYHATNQGETTWLDFARALFQLAHVSMRLTPITTQQSSAPALRPHYSVLDCGKLRDTCGVELPSWEEGLREYMRLWSQHPCSQRLHSTADA